MFQAFKIFLYVNDRIEITAIRNIHDQLAEPGTLSNQFSEVKERWNIHQLYTIYFYFLWVSVDSAIFNIDKTRGRFHPDKSILLGPDQSFFDRDGYCSNGS